MLIWIFSFLTSLHAQNPEVIYEVVGFSPELNAVFAVNFEAPDNRKCQSYILDLDKKKRFILPPQPDIAKAVVAMGEEDERSSCALRSFDVQLELKLKNIKSLSPEEKKALEPLMAATTNQPALGFKDTPISSLGAWLKTQRPKWSTPMAQKLYDLGALEAEDSNWLDSHDALVIAADLKPGISSAEGIDRAKHAMAKAAQETSAKSVMIWEVATRLDPKSAAAALGLAGCPEVAPERAMKMVQKALALDPVLTTRTYREEAAFKTLRCESKLKRWRARLPGSLTQGVDCLGTTPTARK